LNHLKSIFALCSSILWQHFLDTIMCFHPKDILVTMYWKMKIYSKNDWNDFNLYNICNVYFTYVVEVKFKFLQNISHYYNNRFAFHMPMFIIFVLSLNKLNTTIHSNIKFMVITYNQNLHFWIHCKKLQKQDYNSFHHNLTL
jgi:hypothetical protein